MKDFDSNRIYQTLGDEFKNPSLTVEKVKSARKPLFKV